MHVLGRAGLVRSVRGAGGGYQFVGNTRRTTLLDIIQLFENFGTRDDDGAPGANTSEGATLREVLGEIDDIARATLGSITIATLLSLVERQHRRVNPPRKRTNCQKLERILRTPARWSAPDPVLLVALATYCTPNSRFGNHSDRIGT